MPKDRRHLPFETAHPAVAMAYFVGTVLVGMFALQPVYVGIWLVGGLALSLACVGWRDTLSKLRWIFPMLALVCLVNPLFVGAGSTLLLRLGPLSVYRESLAYGLAMGALLAACVLWLEGASRCLAPDRLMALLARRAPSLALMLSLGSQLVPQLLRRSRTVDEAACACTAGGGERAAHSSAGRIRTSTIVMGWALEDSVGRADAMRARGWGSGMRRTTWQDRPFRGSDAVALVAVAALVAASALCAWVACSQWRFYPTMPHLTWWWGYAPFALLCSAPVALALVGRARWRGL